MAKRLPFDCVADNSPAAFRPVDRVGAIGHLAPEVLPSSGAMEDSPMNHRNPCVSFLTVALSALLCTGNFISFTTGTK